MSQNTIQMEPSRRYFPEDMISIEQAVPLLGLSKRTIQDMAARRELPLYKIKKCIRFRVSELEEWLQERKIS
ncbi:helix-turn-helix domain-containing protein [Halomonas piscis]|uniref:helix-turn-helix domain-containing protein n=1 Tax=Halomonas piscis TaxID=3031727 RepID=UPI00289E7B40|nr:helix-turn-helix domain-containing protein [Halomonas piscis]